MLTSPPVGIRTVRVDGTRFPHQRRALPLGQLGMLPSHVAG